jgi:8-oxo-dGTP diphosphatase
MASKMQHKSAHEAPQPRKRKLALAVASTVLPLDFAKPHTLVDVVIFTLMNDALHVLLVRRPEGKSEPFPGLWALPGGYVNTAVDVDLLACAQRKLFEKTGLRSPYLEQLGSWGSATRDPRGWSATHAYFALVPHQMPHSDLDSAPSDDQVNASWFAADDLLPTARLAFDHEAILHAAVERLRSKVEYTSLPAFLLPEPFTLPQLQRCYEAVLGRPVDKSGFRTRMLAANFLEEVGVVESSSNRPPVGYRLKDRSAPVVFPRTFSPRAAG